MDVKKDVLFLDEIMDVVQNGRNFSPFYIFRYKVEEICNTGCVSLWKKIKINLEVKRIIKSGNNNKSVVTHEDTDLDLQEAETAEVVN